MPLVSFDITPDETGFNSTVREISSFKNYYEELIYITDPDYLVSKHSANTNEFNSSGSIKSAYSSKNISSIIFYIYMVGVLFFAIRLSFLIYQLFKYIRKNKVIEANGIRLVLLKDNVPSFSFLRWVFLNKNLLKQQEFKQVMAHEKVHVLHKHTVDLLLAQVITMFQWFNPLTWRIQKSIKTCHEYIADRKVIEQGHALFDYQSLLLSQLISIRSVELVNNFNLLSIKKRIAMMNKSKSGRIAKLKAFLVIPILSFAFFFFANMTEKSVQKSGNQLIDTNPFNINQEFKQEVDIPTAKEVKTYDSDFILCTLTLTPKGLYYNGTSHEINKVDKLIESISLPSDKNKAKKMSVLLEIDSSVKMKEVNLVQRALRNHDLLKIGYVAKNPASKNKLEQTALFTLLPPKEVETIDESKVNNLFQIKVSDQLETKIVSKNLTDYIKKHDKYVMLYKYDNQTSYNDYISTVDMVFHTVLKFRREEAEMNHKDYDALNSTEQKVYKKRYPITLTQKNIDMD